MVPIELSFNFFTVLIFSPDYHSNGPALRPWLRGRSTVQVLDYVTQEGGRGVSSSVTERYEGGEGSLPNVRNALRDYICATFSNKDQKISVT